MIERQIDSADAFVLQRPTFLRGDRSYLPRIEGRLSAGTPMACFLDRSVYKDVNPFLENFGIEGTWLGLYS